MPRKNNIQFRKGTYSEWDAQATGVLSSGEPGFVTDFNKLKIGDGSTQWSDLSAINDALTTLVHNGTSSTIPKMSVVYINGAQGDMPSVTLSIATGEMSSSKTYGITTGPISANGTGMVVVDGTLKNLNTLSGFSGVSPGTTLWLSPTVSGGITTTKPYAPNHMVALGSLVRVHNQQGVINVRIQNGFELEELHNVATTGVTDKQYLQYNNATSLWIPTSSGDFSFLTVNDYIDVVSSGISNPNFIRFNDTSTPSAPSIGSVSNGTRLLLSPNDSLGHNAIGVDYAGNNNTWLSVPSGMGFKFYNGSQNILTISSSSINYNSSFVADSNGNITTGSWSGTTISVNKGGTGRTSYSNGQLLIGSGTSLAANTLTGTSGIGITNGSGTITISVTGISSSSITNFNSGVSGLLPTIANSGDNRILTSTGSSVGINAETNFTFNGSLLNVTGSGSFASGLNITNQTANTIASFDANKNIVSLSTSSYPSLTELAYVKGITSNIQTQLDSKQNTLTNPVTGTGVANHIPYWSNSSGLLSDSNQLVWDATNNRLGIGTQSPSVSLDVSGSGRFNAEDASWTFDASQQRLGFVKKTGFVTYIVAGSGSPIVLAHSNNSNLGSAVTGQTLTERLYITSAGNVGIGTSSAGATLDVRGSAVFNEDSGDHDFRVESDGASHMFFIDAGLNRIGINTASPTSTLDVRGSAIFNEDGSDFDFRVEGDTDANLLFVDASTDRVGIGTSTPGYKLQVSGSFGATTKSFRIDHPTKPGWSLEYGSLESPYHGVRLTGRDKVIKGHGTVKLPDYLKDLIHDDESITIQLTNYKHGKILYVSNIDLQNDQFIVKADRAKSLGELEFFWTLTGVRKDVEDLVVEKRN